MALLAFALTGSAAFAEERVHEGGKVKLWIPDNWKAEDGENSLTITDPNDECMIMFMMLDATDLDKAIEALDSELGEVVKDLQTEDKAEKTKINGLDVESLSAKGTVDGTPVELGIMVIKTPSGKVMLAFGMAESAKFEKHQKIVTKVLTSIKKA